MSNFFDNLPDSVKAFGRWIGAILVIVVATYLTTRFGLPVPVIPVPPPPVENYYAIETERTVAESAAPGRNGVHPVLLSIARIKAARKYAADHDGLGFLQALKLAKEVPDADVVGQMVDQKVSIAGAPVGGPLQNLLDWIAAHPEVIEQIVKIILMLLPLFADSHELPQPGVPMFDAIRQAQVPFPLAWERPYHVLAA